MINKLAFLKSNIFWLIILAYLFGVLCRMEWVFWARDFAQFMWNNELMISTNDGYAFAEGARDMLAGFHQPNDLSFYGSPLSFVTALFVRITGLSIESVMIYISAIFSSLIVVPLILLGRDLGIAKAGGVAAFVAVIANSYYNRTMAGYYDTDMLTIVLPCFIIWGLVRVAKGMSGHFIAAFATLAYSWWYPSSITLNLALLGFFVLYTLIFNRRDKNSYFTAITMLFALCAFNELIRLAILVLIALVYYKKNYFENSRILVIAGIAVFALFGVFGGLDPVWFNLKFYIIRSAPDSVAFNFFNVNQTIMESGIVPFDLFCERISSSVIVFVLSALGYIALCVKERAMILALPMIALGFLAIKGGLRFTIYAVPFMAFGFGYFLHFVYSFAKITPKSRKFLWYIFGILSFLPVLYFFLLGLEKGEILAEIKVILPLFILGFAWYFYHFRKDALALFCFCASVFALSPSLLHIYVYKPLSVFVNSEVKVLNELKNIASREDYALAWWDYGYAIRYFSDVKTLIDGGKHLGNDNFAVSKALVSPQITAVNIARAEVEYTERNFSEKFGSNLAQMMKDYNASDVNVFLRSLQNLEFQPPKASRDVYFVLPDRMHNILNVISKFSRLDLKDGKSFNDNVFIVSDNFTWQNDRIDLGSGMTLLADGSKLLYAGQEYAINTVVHTEYDGEGKLARKSYEINPDAGLFVVFMLDYGRFVIMDAELFSSTYVQLFMLENYDKRVFEPVILDPAMKVYKIKK